MSAAVLEASQRVSEVHIEGLALLKIVKHCHESLPQMVTGSLLGLSTGQGVLEVTHAFPNPDGKSGNNAADNEDGDGGMDGGHDFQIEMMRMLREVNVDNNCVGWYQSMYLGIYSTTNVLENQLSYQTDLSPNAVVLLYDPMQTTHGNLVLKCLRLSDECVALKSKDSNAFLEPSKLFESVPVKLTNPGLVRAFLAQQQAVAPTMTSTSPVSLERLDMSTNPYLEKHLEFLCSWVDDLAVEQQKFQYYARQVARDKKNRHAAPSSAGAAEVPRRMESLLIANQIRAYVDQMDDFGAAGLGKLYLAGGLHRDTASSSAAPGGTGGP